MPKIENENSGYRLAASGAIKDTAMAIEDAAVIAGCLASNDDTAASLQHYEALRRGRTASIQNGSRRNATVFHLSGVKAWLRNRAARSAGNHTMDKLYRYNALEATNV